jgi:hypothetical protein
MVENDALKKNTKHTNMTLIDRNSARLMRYGYPLYEVNPSLPSSLLMKGESPQPSQRVDNYKMSVRDDLGMNKSPQLSEKINDYIQSIQAVGEIPSDISISQELDSEKFVKIYLDGIRQYAQLNKAGANLFEFIYEQLSSKDSHDKDTICLNYVLANKWKLDLNRRTYSRGIADLLDKEFLFRTMTNDIYFINVSFMFNGDRLTLVRSYQD